MNLQLGIGCGRMPENLCAAMKNNVSQNVSETNNSVEMIPTIVRAHSTIRPRLSPKPVEWLYIAAAGIIERKLIDSHFDFSRLCFLGFG